MKESTSETSSRGQSLERVRASLKKRYAKERRFRLAGLTAVMLGLSFLVFFFSSIVSRGYTSFVQTNLLLHVTLEEKVIDPKGERDLEALARANYRTIVRNALMSDLGEVKGRKARKAILGLASNSAMPSPAMLSRFAASTYLCTSESVLCPVIAPIWLADAPASANRRAIALRRP